jgi:hypothetical protein
LDIAVLRLRRGRHTAALCFSLSLVDCIQGNRLHDRILLTAKQTLRSLALLTLALLRSTLLAAAQYLTQ